MLAPIFPPLLRHRAAMRFQVRMRKLITFFVTGFLLAADLSAQAVTPPSVSDSLAQMLFGLGGVLALLVGSLWLLKRLAAPRGVAAGLLRVVAATAVGGRERVVIVEVGSTWLVLGVAPGHVSALAEIPRQPVAEPPPGAAAPPVPGWLQPLMKRR